MPYNLSLLSDADTWMNAYLPALKAELEADGHSVTWVHRPADVPKGEVCFVLSCTRLLTPEVLARHRHNVVVHQSALPLGRGWSPLSWQILEGADVVPVTLFEAAADVDSGTVYFRDEIRFNGTELVDELRYGQAETSIRLCLRFIREYPGVVALGVEQVGSPTFYARRGPEQNRLDPDKTLKEQFNLLRIADNERYPAYFELNGETYVLRIEKKATDWARHIVPAAQTPIEASETL